MSDIITIIIQVVEVTTLGFGIPVSIILGFIWYETIYKPSKLQDNSEVKKA